MCHAVEVSGLYTAEGSRLLINYPDSDAALPIHDPQRGVVWIPWGRRSQEHGELPATGWLPGAMRCRTAGTATAPPRCWHGWSASWR